MTSISDNGSTVVDKGGTCSKTQLKISENEKNQSMHIKTKLKNRFFTKKKTKLKTKQKLRMQNISRKFTKIVILINETQMDFKTKKSQIIRFCSTLETSQKSYIANQSSL